MSAHIAESAALYALGALDEVERKRIDVHAAQCAACARALAQASDDVTALEQSEQQFEAPHELERRIAAIASRPAVQLRVPRQQPWMRFGVAIAAALAIGFMPAAFFFSENQGMHDALMEQSRAIARIASSPHHTSAFAAANASVLYAPDGSWYCVVIANAHRPMQVAWKHDGTTEMLGTAVPHGDVAMLYLPKSRRMDSLELMEDQRVVAKAQLLF